MKTNTVTGSQKGTIIFIHGNSSSAAVFNDVMESGEITQTRITVELPGHGAHNTKGAKETDFSVEAYRAKLIDLINKIDDAVLLVGNSLGGHLVIEVAQEINRLKGLVIFGTPPLKKPLNLEEAFLPVDALQTFFTENPTDTEIESAIHQALYNKENAHILIKDFKLANPKVRKAITMDVAEDKFLDQYTIFTNLELPKFIIAGEQDPSVNPKYLKMIENNSVKTCELIKFEECGHYPSIEKPKEFIDTLNKIVVKTFY